MGESIDPARRLRARRARLRWAALPGTLVALALLVGVAMAASGTGARDGTACEPDTGTPDPEACKEVPSGPAEPPAPEKDPPPSPRAEPPPAPAGAPETTQEPARAVCPDGTWAPCTEPSQGAEGVEGSTPAPRRRDCRKRPGKRRPKHCPRLRRHRGEGERGERSPAERRRAARRRAEQRRECERALQLLPVESVPECAQNDAVADLLIAGRVPSRPLPEPLPPGSRLDEGFARLLERVAGKRWPTVLAILRAEGKTGPAPADAGALSNLVEAAGGEHDERVEALADYHRAAGLAGLTNGLKAVEGELGRRVLGDGRINLYPGGRFDVGSGSIDVRVLVTMLYLAERHGGLTVSSLKSGHGIFTRSGHVSLHAYGRAVDIGAVGGVSIAGNQQPGGVTEDALRNVMLLPEELHPTELISLFELGGPSFAMADHADHIHVGF